MTWVKICGITNLQDAMTAVDAGADALGFVFYEKSPRYVTPEAVHDIVQRLPKSVEKIGVFVEQSLDEMGQIAETTGLTGIQLHVKFPHTQCATLDSRTTKYMVLRASNLLDAKGRFTSLPWYLDVKKSIGAVFLDAGSEALPGGTGRTFDWASAVGPVRLLRQDFRIVVAGGLTRTNVREAMRILKPWGVDVSTGVEAQPGKKDPKKVRDFIAAVRNADQEV
jgi:phosphoribosylanthranilate isomerase